METNLKIAVILSAVDKMSTIINGAVNTSISKLDKMQKKADSLSKSAFDFGRNAGAIGLAIAAPLGLAVKAAEDSEVATNRLNNVFKQMGDTTGKAAQESAKYASALQMQIGVEDESIMLTQAKLATFARVSNETARMAGIFDRATNAAYDLAAAGFGEAEQNAVQLGKALQDPIKGITALARSGVTFTDQEKQKIKTLVESGKILKAQQIVLKAIETQVGGTAKATATSSAKAKAAFGEVTESVGKALLPTVTRLLNKLIPVLDKINQWIDKNPKLAQLIVLVAGAIAAASLAASGMAFIVGGLAKGMSMLSTVFQVATKVAGFLSTAISFVGTTVSRVTMFLAANPIFAIIMAIALAAMLIIKYWDQIKAFFQNLWTKIKEMFSKVVDWIKEWGLYFLGPVGLIIKHWDKIKAFFSEVWENVKQRFVDFIDWLKGIPGRMYEAGSNIVKSIWEGIKDMAHKPIEAIKSMVSKIRDFLPFSPAKTGALRDIHRIRLVETIAESVKPMPLVRAMRATTAAAMIAATPVGASGRTISPMVGAGGLTSVNYSPVINMAAGAKSDQDFAAMLKQHEKQIVKVIDEANRKSKRTTF